MIGTMIGSGIFRVPSEVAGYLPTATGFLLVWVAGGLFALAGALIYAEYAACFVVGGRYVYLRRASSDARFRVCMDQHIAAAARQLGAVALVFAAYLRPFSRAGNS